MIDTYRSMLFMQILMMNETKDIVSPTQSRKAPTEDGYADWNVSEDEAV